MGLKNFKHRLHEIIYEADTLAGKVFDLVLLIFILTSVIMVALESVAEIGQKYQHQLDIAEWFITIIFSVEYLLRIFSIKNPQDTFLVYMVLSILFQLFPNIFLFFCGYTISPCAKSPAASQGFQNSKTYSFYWRIQFVGQSPCTK